MSKVVVYGIEFDTEDVGRPKRIRNNVAIATAKAFCQVMEVGRFTKSQLDILTNEVVRGRLDGTDKDEVSRVADIVMNLGAQGASAKDIAILRSLYFEYEEIKEIVKSRKRIDTVLKDLGLEDPEIETIYGLTSRTLTEWYVPYSVAKEV